VKAVDAAIEHSEPRGSRHGFECIENFDPSRLERRCIHHGSTVVGLAGRAQHRRPCATNVGTMRRWLLLLLGIVLILLGLAVSLGAGGVLALFGADESVSTPAATARVNGAAMLIENIRIDASTLPIPATIGKLHLSANSPTGRALFLGSATASNVDTYLTGAPYDVVVDLTSGGTVTTRSVPGGQTPPPPASQSIWHEQASGVHASIPTATGMHDTSVVMNADGTPGIAADIVVSLDVPGVWRAGWIAVAMGVLSIVLGGVAIWRSFAARKRGRHAAAHAASHHHGDVAGEALAVVPAVATISQPDGDPDAALLPEPLPVPEPVPTPEPVPVIDPALISVADAGISPMTQVQPPVSDPSFIPPWALVDVVVAPAASPEVVAPEVVAPDIAAAEVTVPEIALPADQSSVPEPPVWETEGWMTQPATTQPAPDGAIERE